VPVRLRHHTLWSGEPTGDRHLKIGHLIADRDRLATAAAPAGVGD
jgi:hypothetical protein